jgi:hypothetical protein
MLFIFCVLETGGYVSLMNLIYAVDISLCVPNLVAINYKLLFINDRLSNDNIIDSSIWAYILCTPTLKLSESPPHQLLNYKWLNVSTNVTLSVID